MHVNDFTLTLKPKFIWLITLICITIHNFHNHIPYNYFWESLERYKNTNKPVKSHASSCLLDGVCCLQIHLRVNILASIAGTFWECLPSSQLSKAIEPLGNKADSFSALKQDYWIQKKGLCPLCSKLRHSSRTLAKLRSRHKSIHFHLWLSLCYPNPISSSTFD